MPNSSDRSQRGSPTTFPLKPSGRGGDLFIVDNADYLRPLQAPVGVAPILKCWMELN